MTSCHAHLVLLPRRLHICSVTGTTARSARAPSTRRYSRIPIAAPVSRRRRRLGARCECPPARATPANDRPASTRSPAKLLRASAVVDGENECTAGQGSGTKVANPTPPDACSPSTRDAHSPTLVVARCGCPARSHGAVIQQGLARAHISEVNRFLFSCVAHRPVPIPSRHSTARHCHPRPPALAPQAALA